MSYLDRISDYHAEKTFAGDRYFGDQIEFAPRGNWKNKVILDCHVVGDHLQGSNEVRGDGVKLEKADGRAVRESIVIEFKNCAELQTTQSKQYPDRVKWDGRVFAAVRMLAKDKSMKAYLFVRKVDKQRHGESLRG